ncbi:MAG TPA: dihydroorotase [Candidatus Saccharimonadales bacterium]|nr:dihydroorotase [Candidatus Saccharimonadales bacterium]
MVDAAAPTADRAASPTTDAAAGIGARLASLEISGAWLVDPATGREGLGELVVRDGIIEAVTWLDGADAHGIDDGGIVVAPGFVDLHAHFREPGFEDAETIASGSAAAAHGGFTTVCLMPNTSPPVDQAGVLAGIRAAALRSGSPIEILVYGAVTAGRRGETLAALGDLADAGAVGFSDDGAPVRSSEVLRNALLYAAMLGRAIVDHPEDPSLTAGAEANEGLVASVLGLKGWPAAAEESAVARDIAVLADVLADEPRARLHLTHLSLPGSIERVRQARAAGLPVTCDVTPHHLALSDEWLAGARRFAWAGCDGDASGDPWRDRAITAEPYDPALRVNPPLRRPEDAVGCLRALADGTVDAIATDHAPHTSVDKDVEFGLAANGISGIETALGLVLEAVAAGRLTLLRAVELLTVGPARVLGEQLTRPVGLVEGQPADLVVFDRGATWQVTPEALRSRGKNSPLLGRELRGRVLLTVARGRIAHADDEFAERVD